MRATRPKVKSAGAIIMSADKTHCLLVRQRETQKWGFPKGTCMEGETLENCMYREVSEETGIDLHKYRFFQNGIHKWKRYSLFSILLIDDFNTIELNIHDNNEIDDIRWIQLDKIKQVNLNKVTSSILRTMLFKCSFLNSHNAHFSKYQ